MSYGQMGMISNDIACMARFLPDVSLIKNPFEKSSPQL